MASAPGRVLSELVLVELTDSNSDSFCDGRRDNAWLTNRRNSR